jgi:RNA-directed DNA polymerase
MRRESHVRIWEGGGVRFPSATRLVVLCRSPREAAEALAVVRDWTEKAGLTLHPIKTRLVDARIDGFDFLGYHFARDRRWPRKKSMEKLKDAIRAKTLPRQL